MSQVTKIDCVFCTPSAGDLHGIRRPIAGGITSEELGKLIIHVIEQHTKGDHHGGLQADLHRKPSIADPTGQLVGMKIGEPIIPLSVSSVETVKALVGDDSPSNGAVSSNAFGTIQKATE